MCTLHGLPVGFALTGAKADERQTLLGIFDTDPALPAWRAGQILIADKNSRVSQFFVDQVPAAAQAARTAWVSCGVACSGHLDPNRS